MIVRTLSVFIILWYYEVICEKFVVLPVQTRSRVYPILSVTRELAKYNHSVKFVLSSSLHMEFMDAGISIPHIIATNFNKFRPLETSRAVLENAMIGSTLTTMIDSVKEFYYQCHYFMEDEVLYKALKAEKFDYAIISFSHTVCFEVMAYKLSLPFVYIGAHIDLNLYRVPFFPSFMPTFLSSFTDKMTFTQRIANMLLYVFHSVRPTMPSMENLAAKYARNRPYITNSQLKKDAQLHIVDGDVLMDFTLPIPPNVILCGGLATRATKKLPENMKDFTKKIHGLVVVSFGSIVKTIPKNVFDKLIKAFNEMEKLGFIVRSGNTTRMYKNVLVSPWIPQNDLLGYETTKLFITHCGKSGIFEALYHGVPMIGFPIGKDQFSNAAVIVDKRYGISMDIVTFSDEELIENIRRVIYTNKYNANIQRASKIYHSRPQTPSQRAAYWIDLVSKYGPEQFRPFALDMPWYTYYMVDIFIFFLSLLVLIIYGKQVMTTCLSSLTKKKKD